MFLIKLRRRTYQDTTFYQIGDVGNQIRTRSTPRNPTSTYVGNVRKNDVCMILSVLECIVRRSDVCMILVRHSMKRCVNERALATIKHGRSLMNSAAICLNSAHCKLPIILVWCSRGAVFRRLWETCGESPSKGFLLQVKVDRLTMRSLYLHPSLDCLS